VNHATQQDREAPMAGDFPAMAAAYLDGRLDLGSLITRRIGHDDFNAGFAALKRGEAIRSVVMFA
jgi:S-(hydroxymethyl)glutathione dehydrogenase/alcohol dehydrogenase